ncbi:MAG: hypothetical protein QOI20_2972, partial [Acidimicrobiaceae bacterium]|nr:hypothetical protein [Acidimicrobiaceae bacterium]
MQHQHERRNLRALWAVGALFLMQVSAVTGAQSASAVAPTPADSVYPRGDAVFYGSPGSNLSTPIVDMAVTPDGGGYRVLDAAGKVYRYGNALNVGDASGFSVNQPFTALAVTPSGNGQWLLAGDAGLFAFGDAGYHGTLPSGQHPISIVSTPTGNGYWELTQAGAVGAFGDAPVLGSATDAGLPGFVDMARTPSGNGYWLLSVNGEVVPKGDALDLGDATSANRGFSSIVARPDGTGYWLIAYDGTIVNKGTAAAVANVSGALQLVTGAPTSTNNGLWVASHGVSPPGAVQGVVKNTANQPVKGICVTVRDPGSGTTYQASTSVTGFYRLTGLHPSTYSVGFDDCVNRVYFPQWYQGASSAANAKPVPVNSGQTTVGIGATLTPGSVIAGKVVDATGAALSACVATFDTTTGEHADSATSVSGNYRLGPLKPGSYKVSFNTCGSRTDLLPQFWPNAESMESALPVGVGSGATVIPGINGVLLAGGSITGTVTDKAGNPIANVCVHVNIRGTENRADEGHDIGRATTDGSGFYRVSGLLPGTYAVHFSHSCGSFGSPFADEFFANAATEDDSRPVQVAAATQTPGI